MDKSPRSLDAGAGESHASRLDRDRLLFLLGSGPAVIYSSQVSGDFGATFVSGNVRNQLGYTPEQFLDDPAFWTSRIHPDDAEHVRAGLARLLEHDHHVHEYRFRHADGRWRWMRDEMQLVRDTSGLPLEAIGYWIDITDRHEVEDALRESRARMHASEAALRDHEERFRLAARATNDIIYDWNLVTNAVWYGEGVTTVLGYPPEEVEEDATWWSSRIAPEDHDRVVREVEEVIATGTHSWSGEYLFRKRDGTLGRFLDRGYLVRDSQGRPVRIVGAMMDMTHRHTLEQQLRQAQKMEAIGRLAGGVAHDFNNLLSVIGGYASLVLRRLRADDPLRPKVEEIGRATNRAAALTGQLLAFGRKQVIRPRVLDLDDLVTGMAEMLRRLIGENVELVIRRSPETLHVCADSSQLEQVVMNLAINARDAMPGGGRLTLATRPAELDEAFVGANPAARPGSFVALDVSDTGTGMDPEAQAHVFEPFFTTKGVGKGTGLGLATVYGIVKQHDGYIRIETAQGQGTTFRVYIPRALPSAEASAEATVRQPPTTEGGGETVLLVEDDAVLRDLTAEMLEQAGYVVLAAADAARAMEIAARAGNIGLLVTDVIMPGQSGRDLARTLSAVRPQLKVLYVSGYTDEIIAPHGVLEPGLDFLPKPFDADTFVGKVREILARR
jgi:two-component system, cell cycle sensor histidine kinase and response regulator CckA